MQLQAGLFLYSTPALQADFFAGSVLYVTEYNETGAVGFVINRPFERSLHELEEFARSRPFALYDGGPVDREHLFFLHRRPDLITDGLPAGKDIYVGGNFAQVLRGLNNGNLTERDVKLFIGYCGWDAGELEAEVTEGSWVLKDEEPAVVFQNAVR